jgi:hypothetical protein
MTHEWHLPGVEPAQPRLQNLSSRTAPSSPPPLAKRLWTWRLSLPSRT